MNKKQNKKFPKDLVQRVKKLERSNLLNKIEKITKKLGEGETIVYGFHTSEDYKYIEEKLNLSYAKGYSMFGGGDTKVISNGDLVLHASITYSSEKSKYPVITSANDSYEIKIYLPEKWEMRINELYTISKSILKQKNEKIEIGD